MGSRVILFKYFILNLSVVGMDVFCVLRSAIKLEQIHDIIRRDFFKLFLLTAILNFLYNHISC